MTGGDVRCALCGELLRRDERPTEDFTQTH
jgi:hypothetical protein